MEVRTVPKVTALGDGELFMKVLIYAEFGVGKTRFAGTAADHEEMRDVLFVRVEDGTLTVRGKDIKSVPMITEVSDMHDVFWALASKKKEFQGIKTVVIDSGTDLVQLCTEEVVRKNCARDSSKDPDRVTIRDWGDVNFILTKLFRMFRDLPMHVIMTALVREVFDTDDPETKLRRGPVMCVPDFPPKLGNRTMAFFDHVWSLHRTPTKENPNLRTLMTQPKKPWMAKTRGEAFAEALGPAVQDPTLPQLFELLKKTSKKGQ